MLSVLSKLRCQHYIYCKCFIVHTISTIITTSMCSSRILIFFGTIFSLILLLRGMRGGEELPLCICSRMLDPVCGSNGKTYANECMFNCLKSQDEKRMVNTKLRIIANQSCESVEFLWTVFNFLRNYFWNQ